MADKPYPGAAERKSRIHPGMRLGYKSIINIRRQASDSDYQTRRAHTARGHHLPTGHAFKQVAKVTVATARIAAEHKSINCIR